MPRQAIAILSLAIGLGYSCASSDAPTNAPADRSARRRGGEKSASRKVDFDLRAMLPPVPEYEGSGRNLFAYGPVRRAPRPTPPPSVTPTPRAQVQATTTIARTTPTRPATRVNVKYAGFVEKTEPTGDKAKYAIFLDGNEIFAGAEGDTIANRFTVVEIGLESVTVSAKGSSATQRIPLQAN
jgi:hypothetical protein